MTAKESDQLQQTERPLWETNPYVAGARSHILEYFHVEPSELDLRGGENFALLWNELFGYKGYLHDYEEKESAKKFIATAYVLAEYGHQHQNRKQTTSSGAAIPYISHPIELAREFCVRYRQNPNVIASALLHDVYEDSGDWGHPVTYDDIRLLLRSSIDRPSRELSPKIVTEMVKGLSKVRAETKEQEFIETANNMLQLSWNQPAILGLKIYDRLLNMRTIEFIKPETQYRKAEETVYIYGPLAKRAGLYEVYHELMDRGYSVIDRMDFHGQNEANIKRVLGSMSEKMRLAHFKTLFSKPLAGQVQTLDVSVPHFHEVYRQYLKKRKNKGEQLAQSYDFFLNIKIILSDDETQVPRTFAERRQDLINTLFFEVHGVTKPLDEYMGISGLLEGADHRDFDRPYYLFLRYNDLPLRIKVFTESTHKRYRTALGILSAVPPRDGGEREVFNQEVGYAKDNKKYIREQYTRLENNEMSKAQWMQEFDIVLTHEMTVQFLKHTGEKVKSVPVDLADESTLMDFLLLHTGDDWRRVDSVIVNGQPTRDFSRLLKRSNKIEIVLSDEDTVHPVWLSWIDKATYSKSKVYAALQQQWQHIVDSGTQQEVYEFRDAIEAYGWDRLIEPLTHVEESFKFDKIIPFLSFPEQFNAQTFLLEVGLGMASEARIEDVRQAVNQYWNSILRVSIWVTDRVGVRDDIKEALRAHNNQSFDLVHDEVKRKRAANDVEFTYYFDPQDAYYSEILPALDTIASIANVQRISYQEGRENVEITLFES